MVDGSVRPGSIRLLLRKQQRGRPVVDFVERQGPAHNVGHTSPSPPGQDRRPLAPVGDVEWVDGGTLERGW